MFGVMLTAAIVQAQESISAHARAYTRLRHSRRS
jgi:hypothetical protein